MICGAHSTLAWARSADLTGTGVGVSPPGRVSLVGTTTRAPAVLDSTGPAPVSALLDPADLSDDDEILLSWWTS